MATDSAAARREARRRRILENTESRLNKIADCTAKNNDDDFSDGVFAAAKTINEGSCNGNVLPRKNGSPERKSCEPLDTELVGDIPSIDIHLGEDPSITGSPTVKIIEHHLESKDAGVDENVCVESKSLLWADRLFIIILSICVRLMYEFDYSTVFADTIYIPFWALFVAKLAANPPNTQKLRNAGMIRAALILSGVPSNLLDYLGIFQQIYADCIRDFSIYFFTFSVTHIVLESFVAR